LGLGRDVGSETGNGPVGVPGRLGALRGEVVDDQPSARRDDGLAHARAHARPGRARHEDRLAPQVHGGYAASGPVFTAAIASAKCSIFALAAASGSRASTASKIATCTAWIAGRLRRAPRAARPEAIVWRVEDLRASIRCTRTSLPLRA